MNNSKYYKNEVKEFAKGYFKVVLTIAVVLLLILGCYQGVKITHDNVCGTESSY
jgi:hypothetical protein